MRVNTQVNRPTLEMATLILSKHNESEADKANLDDDNDEESPAEQDDGCNNNKNSVPNQPPVDTETDADATTASSSGIHHARRLLFVSHLVAQFSEVSWQFAVVLFLAACTRYQSLVLVSTYGIVVQLSVCTASAALGQWIDQTNRWVVARRLILWENVAVVAGTVCAYYLLSASAAVADREGDPITPTQESFGNSSSSSSSDKDNWLVRRFANVPLDDAMAVVALLGIHVFGAVAQVLDRAFLVAVERDWIVVMAQEQATVTATATTTTTTTTTTSQRAILSIKDWLSETNVAMKQIDLNCKIVAPALAGIAMAQLATATSSSSSNMEDDNDKHGNVSASNLQLACLFVGGLNVLSLLVEYVCSYKIYHLVPGLAKKGARLQYQTTEVEEGCRDSTVSSSVLVEETSPRIRDASRRVLVSWLPHSLVVYFEYPVCWAGLGLSLLYMNALTFGNGIISAYLLYHHVTLETVGLLRGIASAIGLCGTFVYHFSAKRLSLEATGMWSVTFQFSCLATIFSALHVVARDGIELILLVAGVCLSRVGLWVFDIAVTQMQQQEIPEHTRGLVGGVQQAMNAFFNFLSFTLGLLFPDPKDFEYFVLAGSVSVGLAMVLFAVGVYGPRRATLRNS